MRNFLIWTLTVLLGFEPTLWAQAQANRQAEIKAFLEESKLGNGEQTINQLYSRFSATVSREHREQLRPFLAVFGKYKVPKFSIRQIKEGKNNVYQLQTVSKGQSLTIELIGNQKQFAKINGKVLSGEDFQSVSKLMTKLGLPKDKVEKSFTAPKKQEQWLTLAQIRKLPKSAQVAYFQNMRKLLEAMEDVDLSQRKPKKTAMKSEFSPQLEVIARWLQGEEAWASLNEDKKCVGGGHIALVAKDKVKGLSCGSDGNGNVLEEYRKKYNGELCPSGSFSCNPIIYGNGNKCSSAGRNTTKFCNENVSLNGNQDIPALAHDDREYNEWKTEAMGKAEDIKKHCDKTFPGRSKDSIKGIPENGSVGLEKDQLYTCVQFDDRYNTINSWQCSDDATASASLRKAAGSNYDKICPKDDPKKKTEPEAPPAQAGKEGADAKKEEPKGPVQCDKLPNNQAKAGTNCKNGTVLNTKDFCLDGDKEIQIAECTCDNGSPAIERFVCEAKKEGGAAGSDSEKSGLSKMWDWMKDNSGWLILGIGGLIALLSYDKLFKNQVNDYYKAADPIEPKDPLPNEETKPPEPRFDQAI